VVAVGLPDRYYRELRNWYAQRRERVVALLRAAGFDAEPPEGAYYLLAGIDRPAERAGTGDDDVRFARWAIDELGIGTIPGSSFYQSDPGLGRGTVRVAFPKSDATLDELERRLAPLR